MIDQQGALRNFGIGLIHCGDPGAPQGSRGLLGVTGSFSGALAVYRIAIRGPQGPFGPLVGSVDGVLIDSHGGGTQKMWLRDSAEVSPKRVRHQNRHRLSLVMRQSTDGGDFWRCSGGNSDR